MEMIAMPYVDGPDRVLEDGESVRVPLYLADAGNHQRGYRSVTDASLRDAVQRARSAWIKQMTDAWKTPQRAVADKNPGGGLTCPRCHGDGIDPKRGGVCPRCDGEGYIEAYPQGYEHEPKDAAQPDTGSRPWEIRAHERGDDPDDPAARMRGHLQTERNEENQRRRDLAWARYRDNLQNAWQQGPRGDPSAATRIERQGEQWRHGK
jgi:hypothetical protein